MSRPALDINRLGVDERLALIEELWDSLVSDPEQVPVPDEHKALLEERLASAEASDDRCQRWRTTLKSVRKRLT